VAESSRPSEARRAFLNGRSPEEQVRLTQRTEKLGPRPDDPDWLIAWAAENAARRIEEVGAAGAFEVKVRAIIGESLERLRSELPAVMGEVLGDAVQRLRAEVTSARDSERSRVVAASPPWWRDLAVYVAGLASAVGLAWFLVYLGPLFGRWGVLAAAASAMIFAGMVALWRETPTPASVRRLPVQQLASFIAGLVAYIAIAWLTARGRQLPLAALPAATAAAGVALGLLWRGRR
jgi:hypothetical protein